MGQDMRCEVFNVGTLFRILMAVCVCVAVSVACGRHLAVCVLLLYDYHLYRVYTSELC